MLYHRQASSQGLRQVKEIPMSRRVWIEHKAASCMTACHDGSIAVRPHTQCGIIQGMAMCQFRSQGQKVSNTRPYLSLRREAAAWAFENNCLEENGAGPTSWRLSLLACVKETWSAASCLCGVGRAHTLHWKPQTEFRLQ